MNNVSKPGRPCAPERALAAALLGAVLWMAAGCMQSSTQPATVPSTSNPAVPALGDLQAGVNLTSQQAAALAPAHASWQRDEVQWSAGGNLTGEPPVFEFVAVGVSVLEPPQTLRLVSNLRAFEAGRIDVPGLEEPLLARSGGPGRDGGMGHGGHRPPRGGLPDLGLTPAQLQQIHAAQRTLHESVESLVAQFRAGTLTQEQFEAGVVAAQATFETTLQSILTADQYTQLQQARRDRLVARLTAQLASFDAGVTRRVNILDRILDLSDTQAADITTILTNTKPSIQAVLTNLQDASVTPQQAEAALAQIQKNASDAIAATLTPEQATLFNQLRFLRRLFHGCRP